MTNPTAAIRMLITYVVCIPVAITVGYLLTDPLDYGTLGFLGLLFAILLSPIFIRWHYPLLIFGLGCPMICFFIVGKPPLSQVMTVLSLGIAIIESILNSEKKFLRVPAMAWPLLFICAMALMTAELNGGISLQSTGNGAGGGPQISQFIHRRGDIFCADQSGYSPQAALSIPDAVHVAILDGDHRRFVSLPAQPAE